MKELLVDLIQTIFALVSHFLLFSKLPLLKKQNIPDSIDLEKKLSIIIPVRNEENNIQLLLNSLKNQSHAPLEIICVDDDSTDNTTEIIKQFAGVKLMNAKTNDANWHGKTAACFVGAQAAKGELFLFLDADVTLTPTALSQLLYTHQQEQKTISLLPYHQTQKKYESLSLYFNLMEVAATGAATLFPCKKTGLFGPLILISKKDYEAIGGHEAIKGTIIDDIELGMKLNERKIPFKLLMGRGIVSFRMYPNGTKELLLGWTKNFASGAMSMPLVLLLLNVVWIIGSGAIYIALIKSFIYFDPLATSIICTLFVAYNILITILFRQIGNFKIIHIFLFPLHWVFFCLVFISSLFAKIFKIPVSWKGRKCR